MKTQPCRILRPFRWAPRAATNFTPSQMGLPGSRIALIVCTALFLCSCAPLTTREAGTLTGAGYGAAIGAIAGGSRGAGTGAAIGALTGLVLGDLIQSTQRYSAYPPPTYYYVPLRPQYIPPPYYYPYYYPYYAYPYWPW